MSFTETLLTHTFFVRMSSAKLTGRPKLAALALALALFLPAVTAMAQTPSQTGKTPAGTAAPAHVAAKVATVAEAEAFMKKAEAQLEDLSVLGNRAQWVQENFITDDTEVIGAQAQEKITAVTTQLALEARRFEGLKLPPELARKFKLLKLSLVAPAPNNDKERAELTRIAASLDADYGKGKYCKPGPDGKQVCLSLNDL
jgi:peptidyl-dipeptidase A